MKKSLLFLAAMLMMAVSAMASEVSVTFADKNYPDGAQEVYVQANDNILFRLDKYNTSGMPSYSTSYNGFNLAKNNALIISGGNDVLISKIVITYAEASSTSSYDGLVDEENETAMVNTGTTGTWTGSAQSVTLLASKNSRITAVSVTYTGNGTVYPPRVANIAGFLYQKPDDITEVNSTARVVYQCVKSSYYYLFLKDESGWLYVTGNTYRTYKPGDVIPAGYMGKYQGADGFPQLASPKNFGEGTPGTPVSPIDMNLAQVLAGMCPTSALGKVKDVTVAVGLDENENEYYYLTNGSKTLNLENKFGLKISAGEGRTVTGIVLPKDDSYIMYPTLITDADGKEYVQTPVITPAVTEESNAVWQGTKFTVTCGTADSRIYYTLDGSEPTAASTLYEGPVELPVGTVTVKAIAVADGMANSSVASTTYVVNAIPANVAMFNFTDPASLQMTSEYGQALTSPFAEATATTTITDKVFVNKQVSITITPHATNITTNYLNRMLLSGGKWFYRIGRGSVITISGNGNKIKSVKVNYSGPLTVNDGTNTPVNSWSGLAEPVESVAFKASTTGNTSINSIEVECVDDMTGIEDIAGDYSDAPVEYFNLQGIRVSNPSNGVYIRRQGNKVEKVVR